MKKIFLLLFLFFSSFPSQENFLIAKDGGWAGGGINCQIDNDVVGHIEFMKASSSSYILHSFYVYPNYRGKGYGKKILLYMCNLLKERGARTIYIQPGPFEMTDDGQPSISDPDIFKVKLQRLVKLYKGVGFGFVNKLTSTCAAILYKIIGIDEDAFYLMVRHL